MSVDRCTTHHICDCRQAMLEEAQKEAKRYKDIAENLVKLLELSQDSARRAWGKVPPFTQEDTDVR